MWEKGVGLMSETQNVLVEKKVKSSCSEERDVMRRVRRKLERSIRIKAPIPGSRWRSLLST